MQHLSECAIDVPKSGVVFGVREFTEQLARHLARRVVPPHIRPWLRNPGALRWHALRAPILRQLTALRFRRLQPMFDGRPVGTAIVRWYWNDFLERHRGDVRGDALEVGTTSTIRAYGGDRLRSADAIDLAAHTPDVTLVADLSRADNLPGERYDCFVLQFTMHVIADVEAALYHAVRMLKPGGVLLVNFSCVDAQFPNGLDMGTGAPMWVHWCFTPLQVHNLVRGVGLLASDYMLEIDGNLFARIAYQLNMPAESLTEGELTHHDPAWPVLICARIVRPDNWKPTPPAYRDRWVPRGTAPEQHSDVVNGVS
jgi:SAM-dependent methyltransferase